MTPLSESATALVPSHSQMNVPVQTPPLTDKPLNRILGWLRKVA